MLGVQVKLWDLLRTRAIPERLRGVFTTRRYTNPCLPLPLPYSPRQGVTALWLVVCSCMCSSWVSVDFPSTCRPLRWPVRTSRSVRTRGRRCVMSTRVRMVERVVWLVPRTFSVTVRLDSLASPVNDVSQLIFYVCHAPCINSFPMLECTTNLLSLWILNNAVISNMQKTY